MFSKPNDEYQSAGAATSPSNKERNSRNEPGSSTLRFRALGLKTPSSPIAPPPERPASSFAVDPTKPASDGISHILGSAQSYNERYLSPQQIDPALRPKDSIQKTVSTEPRQARSSYSLRSSLEAPRQWRTNRDQQFPRRLQDYPYIFMSGVKHADLEVVNRSLGKHYIVSSNRPLEGKPTYRYEDADTVQRQQHVRQSDHQNPSQLTDVLNEFPDSSRPGHLQDPVTTRPIEGYYIPEGPSPFPSLLSKMYHGTLTILSRIGLRENDTRPGHKRIRWKNSRGKWLYDDYVEHVPGALEDMKAFLRSSAYVAAAAMNGGNQDAPTSFTPSDNSTSSASQKQYTPLSEIADPSKGSGILHTSDSQTDVELGEMISHPPLLLSCLENGKYAVELRQESIVGVADDRQLFHTLRRIYHEHRGRLRPIWSLKTLHSIHFMKFAYGGTRYIEVRCHQDICETGRPCVCVPPEHLVLPNRKEYDCRPIPPKLSPPISPRLMMDFFMHPDYIAPNSTLIVQQLPKRACGKLQSEYLSPTEAWGIFYKEDWNWTKIWWILALGFFPPSLLFGVLWTVFKQDISGAFGVASWWMAGASIIVGIVGTYDM
ncbi:hypothetical protein ACMYSQ_001606 [Aspergillus niger]